MKLKHLIFALVAALFGVIAIQGLASRYPELAARLPQSPFWVAMTMLGLIVAILVLVVVWAKNQPTSEKPEGGWNKISDHDKW